jgi:hypothetical protein
MEPYMKIERPDLSQVSTEVLAYIQSLEAELEGLSDSTGGKNRHL